MAEASPIRKLLIQFSHFLTGSALTMLLGLVTFPILTRLLGRDEYGMLGLVTTTVSIAVALAKGGLSDGIIRFYRDFASTPERLRTFTSTVLVRGLILSAFACACYGLTVPYIATHWLGVDPRYLVCFYVMLPYLFVRPLNIIVLNYLRALGLTVRYNVNNVATRALGIALSLFMLLYVVQSLYGFFVGLVLAEMASAAALFVWLFRRYSVRLDSVSGPLSMDLLKFGVPLLLTELSYLLLSYVDRYMIVAFHGEDLLGLYSVGYNLPSYINELVMFSLSYAVVPIYTELYATKGREATEAFLSRALRYYVMAVVPLCALYAAVSEDLLVVLASHKYAEASIFSPIILVALVVLGMNSLLAAGLYLQKRTKQMLGIMAAALLVNVLANVLLLPRYGATGAAFSTLIATLVSSVLTWRLARAHIRLQLPLGTAAFYLLVALAMLAVAWPVATGHAWSNVLAKSAACVVLLMLVVVWREPEARRLVRR